MALLIKWSKCTIVAGVVGVAESHVSLAVPAYDVSSRLSRPFTKVTVPLGDLTILYVEQPI